ncbi:hypothetical protein C5167_007668, partial [Papaver somniferum]
ITGHPSVLYYLGSIPQTAGFAAVSVAARVAVIIGLLKFLIFLGRRPLLIVGVSGITTVSLVFLSAYYKILQGHPLVAVGALLLYIGCYQIPFAPISWLMVSEIFHIRTRERGISLYGLSVLKTFGANVLVYFAPSSLKEQIASQLVNSSLLFVGIALASVLFVVFIVPESKERNFITMATTAATSSSIFFNPHTKTPSQSKDSKPTSLISFSSLNYFKKNRNLKLQRLSLLPSRLELRKQLKVGAKKENLSSDKEIQSLVPDGGAAVVNQDEGFSKNSEILPFLFPALGALLFGYDIGAISGAAIPLQSPKLSGTTWFNLSSTHLDLVVRGPFYGALISSVLVYPIADFLGNSPMFLFFLLLILGRFLYGLGIGLAMHGAPLYIAETCPFRRCGTLMLMKELMIVLGVLFGIAGVFVFDGVGGWRYMFGFSAPVALLMGLGMWSLPASPRWLLLRAVQGKASLQEYKERAITGLSRLRGRPSGDEVSEKQVEDTLVSLKEAYANQESEDSLWEVVRGQSLKALTIGGGVVLFLQVTEHPGVLHCAGSFLKTSGFAAISVAAGVLAVIGLFKMVTLLFLSAYNKIHGGHPAVAVAALLLYVSCYQISFVPISWLMIPRSYKRAWD